MLVMQLGFIGWLFLLGDLTMVLQLTAYLQRHRNGDITCHYYAMLCIIYIACCRHKLFVCVPSNVQGNRQNCISYKATSATPSLILDSTLCPSKLL
jgi:hypothetical protein